MPILDFLLIKRMKFYFLLTLSFIFKDLKHFAMDGDEFWRVEMLGSKYTVTFLSQVGKNSNLLIKPYLNI